MKNGEEAFAPRVVHEDFSFFVAYAHNLMQNAGGIESGLTWDGAILSRRIASVNRFALNASTLYSMQQVPKYK